MLVVVGKEVKGELVVREIHLIDFLHTEELVELDGCMRVFDTQHGVVEAVFGGVCHGC